VETWKFWLEIEVERWKGHAYRDKSKQTWIKFERSDYLSELKFRVRDKYS